MNLKPILITSVLAASCFCLQAVETPKPNVNVFRQEESFTEFIGLEVWNLQNERLGKVKFITADLENARLVEVVVTTSGGFLGFGGRTTSIPPRALTLDAAQKVLRVDMSRARFNAAPKFKTSDVAAYSNRSRVASIIRYFGLQPWFFLEGQAVQKNAEILQLGDVKRTEAILGMQINNTQGQYMGKVSSLMMDFAKGHITHVVTDTQAMGGNGSHVIQPRALRYTPAHTSLVLDNTRAELKGEPSFKWSDASRRSFQQEAYVNREVQADKGLHSKQSAQEGIVSNAIPMAQGLNFRDEQKTSRIKQAIQADPSLSGHAKGVEVVTVNAQTTLRGHVNTIEGKRKIGEIAKQAGRPENVSNLIEVRPH
ncbi:MAG: PRC-barrel domain-containing protein [Prosthecobacter sp.]|uniref:PRC-barrel domain-containing protein n=1 Tax=Prosthecobacter sp. TaxID=1965333 RepID=UPI0038FFB0DD